MDKHLIAELSCPYCGGGFRIARECRTTAGRVNYGLLECRCFAFPVVDGVLLLSLAKGYGGAEEELQPYTPLLAAAVEHLGRDDIDGLQRWIRRHLPLAAELIEGRAGDYIGLTARRTARLDAAVERLLSAHSRYGVLGYAGGVRHLRRKLRRLLQARPGTAGVELAQLGDYYVSRLFAPRVNALALQLGQLPVAGRILSLCCGQGVFENLLRADGRPVELVSIDGQFLNLLITREYANRDGNFICHDLQFGLPFRDGVFDGVFSSTCLPEIPAQRLFAAEAIRVTAASGWTVFDSIWNEQQGGVRRIDRYRHYRFCQNFFARIEDYLPLFSACAAGRDVGVDIPGPPAKYLGAPTWTFGEERNVAVAARTDRQISVMVCDREQFKGFARPQRPWLNPAQLSVSPVFDISRQGEILRLRRRPQFAQLPEVFAAAGFAGYPASLELSPADCADRLPQLFADATLALLPDNFGLGAQTLAAASGRA